MPRNMQTIRGISELQREKEERKQKDRRCERLHTPGCGAGEEKDRMVQQQRQEVDTQNDVRKDSEHVFRHETGKQFQPAQAPGTTDGRGDQEQNLRRKARGAWKLQRMLCKRYLPVRAGSDEKGACVIGRVV